MFGPVMGICLKPGQSEIVTAETSLGIFGKEKLFFLDLVVGTAFHLQWLSHFAVFSGEPC